MRLPRLLEIGLVAVGFGVPAVLFPGQPGIDLFFLGVVLSSLLLLTRLVGSAVLRSRRARRHERDIMAIDRGEVSRRAVEQERARLSTEIDRSVRRSLVEVDRLITRAEDAVHAGTDPRAYLVTIQGESRDAMAELRRQLGLIGAENRGPRGPVPPGSDSARQDMAGHDTARQNTAGHDRADHSTGLRSEVPSRHDVVLTLALVVLTVAESAAYRVPGSSWFTSGLMALTVLTRRLRPVPTALAATVILLLGAVLDAAVSDGFSFPIVIGLLLWSLLERRPTTLSLVTAAVLLAGAIGSRFAHDPDNVLINITLLSVVSACAAVVGRSRRSRDLADRSADAAEAALVSARETATETTRRAMARELHDVVSHAVSLVAVQAGAAELAWPHDPHATRTGLRSLSDTLSTALAELDAQAWGAGPAPGWDDIERTVTRLREAGLDVRLTRSGRPPAVLLPVVHRLVQEALTNVLKHAEGARAYVVLSSDDGSTQVEVTDDGPGPVTAMVGYGLAGLEDRVAGVGGRLQVGPGADGGFVLRAVLPHDSATVRGAAVS